MRIVSRLKALYLSYFSKPVGERLLYRTITRHKVRRVLEIGIGTPKRTSRLIDLSQRMAGEPIRYAAVDGFETRPADAPGMSLKEAHRIFKATGASVQLIPGDPAQALARSANALGQLDLILIAAGHDESSLKAAWFYLPRMLHAGTRVLREVRSAEGEPMLEPMTAAEINSLAAAANPRRRAA